MKYREVDVCKSCGVEIDYVNSNDTLDYCGHCDKATFIKKKLDDAYCRTLEQLIEDAKNSKLFFEKD
jgi:predicted RNA-binding Zn-ribbon protein involved in translation (DUF1610 family)